MMCGLGGVSPAYRERLMLAVTAVNGCRYCSFAHSREALRAGIDRNELSSLLSGELSEAPAEQIPALVYAQHWAETNGRPDPVASQGLREEYGSGTARDIELALRVFRARNLTGNTFDYLLFKISKGRWGWWRPA
jgi:AhpD family alkylhydroperoxidase